MTLRNNRDFDETFYEPNTSQVLVFFLEISVDFEKMSSMSWVTMFTNITKSFIDLTSKNQNLFFYKKLVKDEPND